MIHVELSTPTDMVADGMYSKILADGVHGNFCVLPRHTDHLALLVPGILILIDDAQTEIYFACDEGLLVKRGQDVFISVRRAIRGDDIDSLRRTVHARFVRLNEADRSSQTAIASLEANFLRRFLEMQRATT